jgi:hypothetical protein
MVLSKNVVALAMRSVFVTAAPELMTNTAVIQAAGGNGRRMKRLRIRTFGIGFCTLGMAIPVLAGTPGASVEPSTIAILTVIATCFGMWLRARVSRRNK